MKIINKIGERLDNLDKRQSLVEKINPIVEQAFGKGFRGDFQREGEGLSYGNVLSYIAREEKLSILQLLWRNSPWGGLEIRGHFYNDSSGREVSSYEIDGSVITVKPQYRREAEAYAKLYEQEFGKEATVILDD